MVINKENISNSLIQLGVPPAAAHIADKLLVAEPATQSHTSLYEALPLSKAAVTGGLQFLEALGAISYCHDTLGRRQIITFHPGAIVSLTQRRMTHFRQLADQLHAYAAVQKEQLYAQEINVVASVCDELESAVGTIISTWEDKHANG